MMNMNLTKKATVLLTSLAVIVTTLFSFPIAAFADESSVLDEGPKMLYENDIVVGQIAVDNDEDVPVVIDSGFWGSVSWYDTPVEAYQHNRFSMCGSSYAQYKKYWLFGWRTQTCRIKWVDVWEQDGKYTMIYQNDYDGKFHTDNRYE